jgi:hypothetical protein
MDSLLTHSKVNGGSSVESTALDAIDFRMVTVLDRNEGTGCRRIFTLMGSAPHARAKSRAVRQARRAGRQRANSGPVALDRFRG